MDQVPVLDGQAHFRCCSCQLQLVELIYIRTCFLLIFRGEKLYVMKDNRPNQQSNYGSLCKYLCWSVGLIFVAAAITIGALIGGQSNHILCTMAGPSHR